MDENLGLQRDVCLSRLTTLRVGGPCRWFAPVDSVEALGEILGWAGRNAIRTLFLGEGSNVLASDEGFEGLVVQNRIKGVEFSGREVRVRSGENLDHFIRLLNHRNLAGMERMYGIPGTVAGALVGNAGAYGQEIQDHLLEVTFWQQGAVRTLPRRQLEFTYRESIFKRQRDWFVLECRFRLAPGNGKLQEESDAIYARRLEKYPAGLRCPGSFFKNVPVNDLTPEILKKIPPEFVQYGKIPAGKLLEAVGAKGARSGDAHFADYHANLLINAGRARSRDFLALAGRYAERVRHTFGISLQPEVLILDGFNEPDGEK